MLSAPCAAAHPRGRRERPSETERGPGGLLVIPRRGKTDPQRVGRVGEFFISHCSNGSIWSISTIKSLIDKMSAGDAEMKVACFGTVGAALLEQTLRSDGWRKHAVSKVLAVALLIVGAAPLALQADPLYSVRAGAAAASFPAVIDEHIEGETTAEALLESEGVTYGYGRADLASGTLKASMNASGPSLRAEARR